MHAYVLLMISRACIPLLSGLWRRCELPARESPRHARHDAFRTRRLPRRAAWRLRGLSTPFAAAQDSRRLQRAQELLEVFDEQRRKMLRTSLKPLGLGNSVGKNP